MNSPLKYHGGKHYLAKQIVATFPPHLTYCEPYAGGLSVMLAKDPTGVSEVVNDIDEQLTNFWRVVGNEISFSTFYRIVQCMPLSEAEWDRAGRWKLASPTGRIVAPPPSSSAAGKAWPAEAPASPRCRRIAPGVA